MSRQHDNVSMERTDTKISQEQAHLVPSLSRIKPGAILTKKELLDYKLYEATCNVVGLKAEDRNCSSTPIPKAQRMYIDAIDDALLRQPPYRNIKFNVLYIKHFHQKSQALLDFVEELDPSAIILDWCFTKNGDVANLLTKAGVVSRMWMSFERTSIVGMTGNGFIEFIKILDG